MSEFDDLRNQLTGRRERLETQRQALLLAREAAKQAERALQNFERGAGRQDEQQRRRLEAELEQARAEAERQSGMLRELSSAEAGIWQEFTRFTDPREGLRRWPDRYPVLLFPLRLETRFKTGEQGQPQLWVRIFPDTCLVDTFEKALSTQEVESAGRFWASVWRAGGAEALERSAWRDLVAAHGAGRAGWIVRRYLPLNPGEKPVKDNESDVLLIIRSPGPLPAAAGTYWAAYWRAVGPSGEIDQAARDAAYADLEAAVGPAQAAEIAQNYVPFNIDDEPAAPPARADVQVKVAVLQLAPAGSLPTRRSSWSSAPRVTLLPDRFVFTGYWNGGEPLVAIGNPIHTPLIAGPDPNAPPEEQLKPVGDDLQIPDQLAWMFDFERALQAGMALRIDLNPQQAASGFERVVVLGLRLSDSPDQGRQNLSRLLRRHLYSRAGLELLPQGTPTNNTEQGGAGYTFRENPDASFGPFYLQEPQYSRTADPLLRRDGQWLADLLGLRDALVQRIPNAGGGDQLEARAMQIALWTGTLGYMMRTLLSPVFSEQTVARTRLFFTRYVSGRGPLPALRIGSQPYGILLTTAFDRVNWFDRERQAGFLGSLYGVLQRVEQDWRPLLSRVSYIGKAGDPHQVLLDVLGLHPGAAEYYPLVADSLDHKYYELAFLDTSASTELLAHFPVTTPLSLLRSFGYTGDVAPDILNKIYRAQQTPLTGPVVDDRPLSETEPIRPYAGALNYIQWLVQAAQAGVTALQQEEGFDENKKPAALLYLLLRHALQLSFHATGVRLQVEHGLLLEPAGALREPAFVHISEDQGSESRYAALFRPAVEITGSADRLLGDYIAANLRRVDPDLGEQIAALERLALLPTARLERLFAEHIDTASYRLDAWRTGLMLWQLERMRTVEKRTGPGEEQGGEPGPGLFLGAYGWLEPLRPEGKQLSDAELDDALDQVINRPGDAPLQHDPTNQGLIHAPSLNHATTAAVLRSGYVANGGRLAVNLSSRRVRLALAVMEGMRGGQSIGALLGYHFERYVHDNGPLEVRALVYPLRRAFPLAANQITGTQTEEGEAQESIAAMNVVDGRKLIDHVEAAQTFAYPFNLATLPPATPQQAAAIDGALAHIRDINDALADLVLAEGVHQAVVGNFERSAGTLDAFAKGNYPPEPEVIRTPRSGVTLTLRTAVHLPPGPHPAAPTPLGRAEPAVNAWLRDRLPDPTLTGCQVVYTSRANGAEQTRFISQADLGLDASDLVYRLETGAGQGLSDLDEAILHHLYTEAAFDPRHDRPVRILYTAREPGKVNWFELQALLRSLRALTVASRPLQPSDLMRQNEAQAGDLAALTLDAGGITAARDDLRDSQVPALDALAADLANPDIDALLTGFAGRMRALAAYRLPGSGSGFVYEWRAAVVTALVEKAGARVQLWNERLAAYTAQVQAYDEAIALDPGLPEAERLTRLQAAEVLIASHLTLPAPGSLSYRSQLDNRRDDFMLKLAALRDLVDTPRATLTALLADAQATLPQDSFDAEPFDFDDTALEIERMRTRLGEALLRLKEEVNKRIARVDDLLVQHAGAQGSGAVALLQQAGKAIFGEDFVLVSQFTLPAEASGELANAWQHSASGGLTAYLTGDPAGEPPGAGRDFPVDDWLHGVARVRGKMHHWENAQVLVEGLPGAQPFELFPLQLPFRAGDPWLALEFPPGYAIDGDRLLYTAHFPAGFDPAQPLSGLVVDEWTEVVPGAEETTGIAFHFDRPNAEPPQAWLLALPAVMDGSWSWEELLVAVNNALDSAKLRAIEPVHIDSTAYSAFLPATVSAYTFPEISISNNLLRNIQIYNRFEVE